MNVFYLKLYSIRHMSRIYKACFPNSLFFLMLFAKFLNFVANLKYLYLFLEFIRSFLTFIYFVVHLAKKIINLHLMWYFYNATQVYFSQLWFYQAQIYDTNFMISHLSIHHFCFLKLSQTQFSYFHTLNSIDTAHH